LAGEWVLVIARLNWVTVGVPVAVNAGVFVTVLVDVRVAVDVFDGVSVTARVFVTVGVLVTVGEDGVGVDVGGHRNGSVMQMSTVGVLLGVGPLGVLVRVAVTVDVLVFVIAGVTVAVLVFVFAGTGVRSVGPRFPMPGTPQKMSDAPMKAPTAFRGRMTAQIRFPVVPWSTALSPVVVATPSVSRLHTM
jgi:hypothetical protein